MTSILTNIGWGMWLTLLLILFCMGVYLFATNMFRLLARPAEIAQELREREEQVDRYQQEQDELNVALSGVLDDQINSHATRLQAIHALRNRLMLLKRETSA